MHGNAPIVWYWLKGKLQGNDSLYKGGPESIQPGLIQSFKYIQGADSLYCIITVFAQPAWPGF